MWVLAGLQSHMPTSLRLMPIAMMSPCNGPHTCELEADTGKVRSAAMPCALYRYAERLYHCLRSLLDGEVPQSLNTVWLDPPSGHASTLPKLHVHLSGLCCIRRLGLLVSDSTDVLADY